MRGGHNAKSLDEHLKNGTYRPARHGKLLPDDGAAIQDMKRELYTRFKKLEAALKKTDINSDPEYFKKLLDAQIATTKAFHSLCRGPVPGNQEKASSEDKFGFK